MDLYADLTKFDGEVTIDEKKIYSFVINGIGWVTITSRSDLAYLHAKLSRYVINPGPEQFN